MQILLIWPSSLLTYVPFILQYYPLFPCHFPQFRSFCKRHTYCIMHTSALPSMCVELFLSFSVSHQQNACTEIGINTRIHTQTQRKNHHTMNENRMVGSALFLGLPLAYSLVYLSVALLCLRPCCFCTLMRIHRISYGLIWNVLDLAQTMCIRWHFTFFMPFVPVYWPRYGSRKKMCVFLVFIFCVRVRRLCACKCSAVAIMRKSKIKNSFASHFWLHRTLLATQNKTHTHHNKKKTWKNCRKTAIERERAASTRPFQSDRIYWPSTQNISHWCERYQDIQSLYTF